MTTERLELHRHDVTSGRWVSAVRHDRSIRIAVGSTGNALDPAHRVRLSVHELTAGRRPALHATWPVREVVTDRVVEVFDDLSVELRSAGSPDPTRDLTQLDRWWHGLVGDDADDPRPLTADLLGRAYPLLAVPVVHGARPRSIPLAAEPLLVHPDPRTSARRNFGRVTRPLVRAFARALLPRDDGDIAWEPVLLASMAAGRCGPEQLTAILTSDIHHPGAVSFSLQDVDRARAMFADRNPRRVADTLVAALVEPGGTARLATTLMTWDARPPAPPPQPQPAPRPAPPRPAARRTDPCAAPTPYPPRIRAVDGATVAGHQITLLRTPDELVRWGQELDNCLGAYRTVVAAGRTHIFGLSWTGRLRIAVEISPARLLRQLETAGNRRPDRATETEIIGFFRRSRLVEVDARRLA